MTPEISASMKNCVPPMRTTPVRPLWKLSTSSDARREASSIAWPSSASERPSGVGCIGLRPLTNNGSPSRRSSMASVRETAGCAMPIMAAPSVTPPACTTAASWIR